MRNIKGTILKRNYLQKEGSEYKNMVKKDNIIILLDFKLNILSVFVR